MPSCYNDDTLNLRIVYVFPRWLLSKAMSALVSRNQQSVMTIVLSTRHYSNDEAIFDCIVYKDMEGIKRLIMQGKVSLNERERQHGQTALHVSSKRTLCA